MTDFSKIFVTKTAITVTFRYHFFVLIVPVYLIVYPAT